MFESEPNPEDFYQGAFIGVGVVACENLRMLFKNVLEAEGELSDSFRMGVIIGITHERAMTILDVAKETGVEIAPEVFADIMRRISDVVNRKVEELIEACRRES